MLMAVAVLLTRASWRRRDTAERAPALPSTMASWWTTVARRWGSVSHMPGKPEFVRIIEREARAALAPLGVVQKGRSRIWLDDRVWWTTMIEFQPSKYGNASFLNVGVCWLTYAKDYLSFDLGGRLMEATEFADSTQFSKAMRDYAQLAADQVTQLRLSLASPAGALNRVREQLSQPGVHDWERYHAAILAGLAGDIDLARRFLSDLLTDAPLHPWQRERAERAATLLALEASGFREQVAKTVIEARMLLKLPPAVGPIFSP
jgi:hypothetical protein